MAEFARPGPTVSLEAARDQLLAALHRLTPRPTPLDQALGTVLATEVIASENIPSFANAAMDGYAVRAADIGEAPGSLRLVGRIAAGHPATTPLEPGQAMTITTGAPLPPGADSVCMVEHAVIDGDDVTLEAGVQVGQHVRHTGEDVTRGSLVFDAGTEIRPAHIGVLASLGVREVTVYPRARVGVLSTGDELQSGSGELGDGKIRDSNRHALLALVSGAGCEPIDLGIVGDEEVDIQSALDGAPSTCDAIITSGGVSVGVADHMKTVLGRLSGGSAHWMEVAIKPAKPFGFATIGSAGMPVLCVPGNPVSALVSFELLARGAVRFMMGHSVLDRPRWNATAAEPLRRRRDGKVHLVRVLAGVDAGTLMVRPIAGQGSHQLRSTALANALAVLPDGEGMDTGEVVSVILLEPDAVPDGRSDQ